MMRLTTIVVAAAMTVGGMAFLGCETANPSSSQNRDDRSGFSGGNGEFGESPALAGSYAEPSPVNRSHMSTTRPPPDARQVRNPQ